MVPVLELGDIWVALLWLFVSANLKMAILPSCWWLHSPAGDGTHVKAWIAERMIMLGHPGG